MAETMKDEATIAAAGGAAWGGDLRAQLENIVLHYGRKCIMFGVQDEKSWLQRRSEDDYDRADPAAKDAARAELMDFIDGLLREGERMQWIIDHSVIEPTGYKRTAWSFGLPDRSDNLRHAIDDAIEKERTQIAMFGRKDGEVDRG